MRKIYSLVLMATMLLVGTNAWADVHATQQSGDEAKVKINDGAWQYATTLKQAFDAVEMGQTAEIVLLDNVILTKQVLGNDYGITMPHTIVKNDMTMKAGPIITLNMNGKRIDTGTGLSNDSITIFRIVKGSLNITGSGVIHKPGAIGAGEATWGGSAAIAISGTNDKSATNWSTLTVGKNVTIHVESKYIKPFKTKAIAIVNAAGMGSLKNHNDVLYSSVGPNAMKEKYGYYTRADKSTKSQLSTEELGCMVDPESNSAVWGAAYGVKVTIAGTVIGPMYGVHVHGNINARPGCVGDAALKRDTVNYPNAPYHQYNYPYINITSTAHIESSDTLGSTGIYSSGYAVVDIRGEVVGATGIYMKGGDIQLTDANIWSNCTQVGENAGGNSGIGNAGGSAISIETSDYYPGQSGVTIQGDTKVTGGAGYAIFDKTTAADGNSTVSHITVEGGTIEGGSEGGIKITEGTVDVTTVAGGNVTATVTVSHGDEPDEVITVNNFIPEGTHTTTVQDGDKTIVVVSAGAAPTGQENFCNAASTASIKWTGTSKTITTDSLSGSGNKLVLKELEINNMSGTPAVPVAQNLTIASGVTLEVGKVILGPAAVVTVEAGAKLLVTDKQGMVAPVTSNLVLKATATSQATFVISHKVVSNKQPKASVEYYTDAYGMPKTGTSTNYKWDRLTYPMSTYESTSSNYSTLNPKPALLPGETGIWTFIEYYDEVNARWVGLTAYNQMQAFTSYALTNNTAAGGITYTFKGNVQGNVANNIELDHAGWNYMGNAFLAPIHVQTMLTAIENSGAGIDNSMYLWNMNNQSYSPVNKTQYTYNLQPLKEIPALQTFIIKLTSGNSALLDLDYENSVYKYVTEPASYSAPQRTIDTDVNVFRMNITSANGEEDNVYMVESGEFTADYDNGADIVKYMNNGINFYAEGEEKYAMVASDNIQGTIFSLQTTEAINYTLTFANVIGEEYALRDIMTNTVMNIVEGATYNFYAQPNEIIEGRFQIVSRQEMPTAVETVEETVNAPKAIYTIMGQYVGQDWNTLPAGVYVVDGVKVVK